MKENITYKIQSPTEIDGLVFTAKKEQRDFTFLISPSLQDENKIQQRRTDLDYYNQFVETHIDSLIKGAEQDFYVKNKLGYFVIDHFANFQ